MLYLGLLYTLAPQYISYPHKLAWMGRKLSWLHLRVKCKFRSYLNLLNCEITPGTVHHRAGSPCIEWLTECVCVCVQHPSWVQPPDRFNSFIQLPNELFPLQRYVCWRIKQGPSRLVLSRLFLLVVWPRFWFQPRLSRFRFFDSDWTIFDFPIQTFR